MDSVEAGSQAKVGAVIHDQLCPALQRTPQFPALTEHRTRMARLVAVLNERSSPLQELTRKMDNGDCGIGGRGEALRVNDGIEARNLLPRHQDCKAISWARSFCSLGRRRSRYLVSVF